MSDSLPSALLVESGQGLPGPEAATSSLTAQAALFRESDAAATATARSHSPSSSHGWWLTSALRRDREEGGGVFGEAKRRVAADSQSQHRTLKSVCWHMLPF